MTWTAEQQAALLKLIQQRNERTVLHQQLTQAQTNLAKKQEEQVVLRNQWQREQEDVNQLHRLSWASVYYSLLSRKEEQISREEVEAQQARLRYDAVSAAVEKLQNQLADQQKRLSDYIHVDKEYEQLLSEKRIAFRSGSDAVYEQYQQRLSDLIQSNHYVQELDEAYQAGRYALHEVMHLRSLLEQARNWGRWDLLGGSTLSSAIKYQKLDDVREQSYRVTYSLQKFRAEYADLNRTFLADWHFDDNTSRFVDIFFDNIFTDWSVQSRINNALLTAQALENQLVATLTALKGQLETAVEQAKQKADAFQQFLENA